MKQQTTELQEIENFVSKLERTTFKGGMSYYADNDTNRLILIEKEDDEIEDCLIYFFDENEVVHYKFTTDIEDMLNIMSETEGAESTLYVNFDGYSPWDIYKTITL